VMWIESRCGSPAWSGFAVRDCFDWVVRVRPGLANRAGKDLEADMEATARAAQLGGLGKGGSMFERWTRTHPAASTTPCFGGDVSVPAHAGRQSPSLATDCGTRRAFHMRNSRSASGSTTTRASRD